MRRITLIATGGTIEKTYDEKTGAMLNRHSVVRRMLDELRIEETAVGIVELMCKDSLDITDEDRTRIVEAVRGALGENDGIVVLHGTDTLSLTGRRLHEELPAPPCPIVLTGALRPYEMRHSDSLQNLTEAIFATGVLPPGIHCVAHGRALRFPGVRKDAERGTFVTVPDPEGP